MNVKFQNATALGSFSAEALEPVTEEGMAKSKLLFLHAVVVAHTECCSIKSKTVPKHLSQRSQWSFPEAQNDSDTKSLSPCGKIPLQVPNQLQLNVSVGNAAPRLHKREIAQNSEKAQFLAERKVFGHMAEAL